MHLKMRYVMFFMVGTIVFAPCRDVWGQTTWYVATNGNDAAQGTNGWGDAFLTINKAVEESVSGDTVLVGAGEYLLTSGIVNADKDIHLLGVAGRDSTIINGNYPAYNIRPLWMGAGRVGGFTITNGIHNTLGNFGGGVYLENAVMTNCIITGNMPRRYGGGVAVYTGAMLSNCIVRGNRVEWEWGGSAACYGGGVLISGGEVWDCLIMDNSSENTGGGCYIYPTGGLLANSTVSDNIATTNAGGVYLGAGGVVSNSVIRNNQALGPNSYTGGGVYQYRGGIVINCLIYGNQAPNGGSGGLYVNQNGEIDSCTIAGNTANSIGGLYSLAAVADYDVYIVNTIIYSNTATDGNHNWVSAGTHTWFTNCCVIPSAAAYGSGNITNYPMFVNPSLPDPDYRLQRGSPCINAGTNRPWMTGAVDVDRRRRLDWASGLVDIGCFEYVPHGTLYQVK